MKAKLLNIALILTSLIAYLEWGTEQRQFLFEMELEVLSKLFSDPNSVAHPLVFLPLLGQILLIVAIFLKKARKLLTYSSFGLISSLLLVILLGGILSFNLKIIASTLPFFIFGFLIIKNFRK